MIKTIKAWLELPAQVQEMKKSLQLASSALRTAGEKFRETAKMLVELKRQVGELQPLRDAINTLEGAGVRRKFGNVIDVDYDRFLSALGQEGEEELARTIAKRRTETTKGAASIVRRIG